MNVRRPDRGRLPKPEAASWYSTHSATSCPGTTVDRYRAAAGRTANIAEPLYLTNEQRYLIARTASLPADRSGTAD